MNQQLKSSLWSGSVRVGNIQVEWAGCFGGGDCAVDLAPLGLSCDAPPS